jgi:hypothetical protein
MNMHTKDFRVMEDGPIWLDFDSAVPPCVWN